MASAFKNSPQWVKRMEQFFIQSDLDKNNRLSIEDFELWDANLRKEIVKADPALLEKLHEATRVYWEEACGLKPGVQLTKDQFVDRMSEVAAAERDRYDGQKVSPRFFQVADALYDVADTNRDGFLTVDEYEKVLKATHFDAGTAKIIFDVIDENHDGKISRQELKNYNFNFWFVPDSKLAGMYGAKYE